MVAFLPIYLYWYGRLGSCAKSSDELDADGTDVRLLPFARSCPKQMRWMKDMNGVNSVSFVLLFHFPAHFRTMTDKYGPRQPLSYRMLLTLSIQENQCLRDYDLNIPFECFGGYELNKVYAVGT